MTVVTVGYGGQYCPLPATVGHGEALAEAVVPSYIGILKHVDDDEESDEDLREATDDELHEEDTVLDEVEGLGHVHHAHEDLRPIPEEVVDRLHNHPGAHCSGDASLVGELKIVKSETVTEQEEDDPVKGFQH